MKTTFNPERDREPHLTITLEVPPGDVDRGAVAERVMAGWIEENLDAPRSGAVYLEVFPSARCAGGGLAGAQHGLDLRELLGGVDAQDVLRGDGVDHRDRPATGLEQAGHVGDLQA